MSDNFKITAGILCDALRREDNGKLLLIGVYSASILTQAVPATLILCCIAIVEAFKKGEFEIEFEVLLDGKLKASGKGKLGASQVGMSLLPIHNILLNNLELGNLKFQLREPNKNWQTILEIPIVKS